MENLLVPGTASLTLPGTRILVLAPHPDDEVFGCGGAILRHLAQGNGVHVVICTDGAWGATPEGRAAYIEQRRNESRAAAHVLGYGTPEFWGREDRALHYSEKLVQEILAAIDAIGADLVYAPSVLEMHPDHRALAMAAVEAVRRRGAALRIALYEVGVPLRPNLLLDITDLAARKLQAMQCFTSQLDKQRYDLDVAALNRFRSYTLPPAVSAAEAYVVVAGDELQKDPLGLYQSEHMRQRALGLPLDSGDYPLVSVLMRSMDRPSLAVALDSVALQTYPNIEVVVVNAKGSAHRALGEWCGPFPLRVVEPGRALDRAAAANRGLDEARGELLIFLDDDDLFLPHHITRLVAELERNAHAVGAYAGVHCTDPAGKDLQYFAEPFDSLKFAIGNFIPIHAMLFRRAVLAKGARFDETLPVCEDWDFWLQLQQQGAFRFVPETGAVYRMQVEAGSGVWIDQDRNREVILRIYRKRILTWSDKVLWGLFEWTRYKPLHEALMADFEKQVRRFDAQVAADEARLSRVREAHEAVLGHQQAEIAWRDEWLGHLQAAEKQYQQGIRDRDEHIARLHASTSWRITRPLRRLAELLGKKHTVAPLATPPEAMAVPQREAAREPWEQQPAPAQENPYTHDVNLQEESAGGFVCELTGQEKRVLEVGCGPGAITKLLKGIGRCRVTGIELDAAAIDIARPWCEAIHQADLNAADWPRALGGATGFDTVIAADVLEHLYDPWTTLRQMATLIAPEGSVVVSLPHAGHAAIAGSFINGDVAYGKWGLLDRTHIRFFGLKNIEELFAQAGLKIIEARYVRRAPEDTELAAGWQQLPEFVRAALRLSKHADIYQVVVKAVSVDQPGRAIELYSV